MGDRTILSDMAKGNRYYTIAIHFPKIISNILI